VIGEVHTGFWWKNLREGYHLEDAGVDGNIKMVVQEVGWRASGGLIWLGIGTDEALL
jgi:hypothetical protein